MLILDIRPIIMLWNYFNCYYLWWNFKWLKFWYFVEKNLLKLEVGIDTFLKSFQTISRQKSKETRMVLDLVNGLCMVSCGLAGWIHSQKPVLALNHFCGRWWIPFLCPFPQPPNEGAIRVEWCKSKNVNQSVCWSIL